MKPHSRLRKLALRVLDGALLRGAIARLSYRLGGHGAMQITAHEIELPLNAPLTKPLTVAFASDFHAGPTTHPAIFGRLVDELIRHAPDALLLGGDYVSCRPEHLSVLLTVLARYQPPLGTYAILGNHDVWADATAIVRQLRAAGILVLVNGHQTLPSPFNEVSICGIDDPWVGKPDLARAFEGSAPIRIFLTHSPDALLLLKDERFNLALAGHTHGGQIALPNGTPIVSAGGPLARTYSRGRFELPDNGPLIVSRGVGCSNIPLRLNANPELTLCTLMPSTRAVV
jgi:predicted MPP superfamily phosphohydrolase